MQLTHKPFSCDPFKLITLLINYFFISKINEIPTADADKLTCKAHTTIQHGELSAESNEAAEEINYLEIDLIMIYMLMTCRSQQHTTLGNVNTTRP